MSGDSFVQVTIRVPGALLVQADLLIPWVKQQPFAGQANRASVLREALARGLKSLGEEQSCEDVHRAVLSHNSALSKKFDTTKEEVSSPNPWSHESMRADARRARQQAREARLKVRERRLGPSYPIPDPADPPDSPRQMVYEIMREAGFKNLDFEAWTWVHEGFPSPMSDPAWTLTLLPESDPTRPRTFLILGKAVVAEADPDKALVLAWRYRGRKKETLAALDGLFDDEDEFDKEQEEKAATAAEMQIALEERLLPTARSPGSIREAWLKKMMGVDVQKGGENDEGDPTNE